MIIHLGLTLLILFLCSFHYEKRVRTGDFLPMAIILLAFYWAFMYDYGLDYRNYHDIFYQDQHYGDDRGEPFFWTLFFAFPSFYLFIFFYSIFISFTVYYVVKHNVPPKYYALFFFIFMLHPSLCLNITYVMRSAMGSCIVWLALTYFYVRKVNIIYLYLLIGAATLFHHTLALCFLLPIVCYVIMKVSSPILFISLIIALCFGVTNSLELFTSLIGGIESFESYVHYGEERLNNEVSIAMIASRALHLVPAFFILRYRKTNEYTERLCAICVFYYLVYFVGLDMLGRLTMMLYVFVIICSIIIAEGKKCLIKMMIIFPSVLFSLYRNVMFYIDMASTYKESPGNMLEYKTIFSLLF